MNGADRKKFRKIYPLLNLLSRLTETDRQTLLPYLSEPVYDAVTACIENAMTNRTLGSTNRGILKQAMDGNKNNFRAVINPKSSKRRRQKAIVQTGGALGLILATVLPMLANLIFNR